MARLFISHERIERLSAESRVVIDDDRLEVPSLNATFRLQAAVYFARVVTDDGDTHQLVGRVKTEDQLKALGAELLADSVVLGETAYDCETGFVGEVISTAGGWAGQLKQLPE